MAHWLTTGIATLAILNNLLRLYLLGDPTQTMTVLVVVIVALGLFFFSFLSLMIILAGAWLGWLGVAVAQGSLTMWLPHGVALVMATAVSILIFHLRLRTMHRYGQLREEGERRRKESQYRVGQLETSLAVGQSITTILDLDLLLARVVELIHERYGHYYVGIYLIDDGKQHIQEKASAGKMERPLTPGGVALQVGKEGLIGWVAANGRPARVDNVAQDERYVQVAVLTETKSELACG
jgi:hypothetical protein